MSPSFTFHEAISNFSLYSHRIGIVCAIFITTVGIVSRTFRTSSTIYLFSPALFRVCWVRILYSIFRRLNPSFLPTLLLCQTLLSCDFRAFWVSSILTKREIVVLFPSAAGGFRFSSDGRSFLPYEKPHPRPTVLILNLRITVSHQYFMHDCPTRGIISRIV